MGSTRNGNKGVLGAGAIRALAAVLGTVLCLLTASAPVSADSSAALVTGLSISGHGYGHGIGLSQWGAEERARAGQSHQEILSFYYPGTQLGTAPSHAVRVLLAQLPRLVVGSSSGFTVVDTNGKTIRLPSGHYPVSTDGAIAGRSMRLPITIAPGEEPIMLGGSRYHGTLTLSLDGGRLDAVNAVGLEQYVGDVVSFENPAYWPAEALRAQAIASRSYALANLHPEATWDLYPDDRSQNYGGLRKEYPSALSAAAATRGQVLLYHGNVVDALFSASNGGLTSTTDGVWDGPNLPYFTVRTDQFDALSPASSWGPVRIGLTTLRRSFPDLPPSIVNVSIATNPAGRATSVTFLGSDGSSLSVDGEAFQERLALRSTFLSLQPTY